MARPVASARARRMLAILHLFSRGTRVSLDAVAHALGATRAEVVEDLELLACCGVEPYTPDVLVPVLVDGEALVVMGALPALERPARLSPTESRAIVAALDIAGVPADDPLVTRLMEAAASAEVSAPDVAQVLRAAATAERGILRTLSHALSGRHVVRLVYQGTKDAAASERLVEPVSLVNERGVWYLEAFCRSAGALRTFRVDRVREATALDEGFEARRVSPTGVAFASDGLPLARVRLAPGEDVSERDWPGMRVVGGDESGTLIDVPYAGTAWIARQVVARLGAAEVLAPAEVREAVRALAAQTAAEYASL